MDAGVSRTPWNQMVSAEPTVEILNSDAQEAHLGNFLDCVRSRQELNCPVEIAAAAVTGPHLANLAYRQDRKIRHDSTVNG